MGLFKVSKTDDFSTTPPPGPSTASDQKDQNRASQVPPADPTRPPGRYAWPRERIQLAADYLDKTPPRDAQKAAEIAAVDCDLNDDDALTALQGWNAKGPRLEQAALRKIVSKARREAKDLPGSKCHAEERWHPTEPVGDTVATKSLAREVYDWNQRYTKILYGMAGRIRLNVRSGLIQIGDHVLDLETALARFQRDLGSVPEAIYYKKNDDRPAVRIVPNDIVVGQLVALACENEFDPFREELEALPAWDGINRFPLLLAALNLKAPLPIYETFLRKTLIALMARTYRPGCKLDTLTILHADRGGENKSTFFRVLVGDANFSDATIDVHSKDSLMLINKHACHEWTEMEAFKTARSNESVKGFLSRQTDSFRLPYGRQVKDYPRRSIFVGTTNSSMLFENDGGLRRYWVIPNVGKIDIEAVRTIRDQLLAQALAEFRAGATWWLDEAEDATHGDLQQDHTFAEIGSELVAKRVLKLDDVTISELVTTGDDALNTPRFQSKQGQMSIARILKSLGWESFRESRGGVQAKRWRRGPNAPSKAAPSTAKAGIFSATGVPTTN